MIPPINFIWKQLNGPQISGIVTAIYNWIKESIQEQMTYWHNLTLSTARSDQLTTMGLLMDLGRPYVQSLTRDDILFANTVFNPSATGFDDIPTRQSAEQSVGHFTDSMAAEGSTSKVLIPTDYYRIVLQCATGVYGEVGSLRYLDAVTTKLYERDVPVGTTPPVHFYFLQEIDEQQQRAPGDVIVDLGLATDWNNILRIQSVVTMLAQGIYAPMPRVFNEVMI